MSAPPGQSTYDGNPLASPAVVSGYRPGLSDGGGQLSDDVDPADPNTEPSSVVWNYFRAMMASLGRAVPVAGVGVNGGTTPTFANWWTAANTVNANPFALWRNAAGDMLVTHSGMASTWQASTAYTATYPTASFAVPTTANANGYYFRCTTAGTSGTSEPAWTTVVGSTVNDGSAVWTCIGPVLPPGLPLAGWPQANLVMAGGAHSYSIQASYVGAGLRVTTQQDGALADLSFRAEFF